MSDMSELESSSSQSHKPAKTPLARLWLMLSSVIYLVLLVGFLAGLSYISSSKLVQTTISASSILGIMDVSE